MASTLSALRKARGYTQVSLSLLVGVTANTVSRWEQGYTQPYPRYRRRLAKVLQVPKEELIFLSKKEWR